MPGQEAGSYRREAVNAGCTMRALVFEGPGRLRLAQVPTPSPGPGEVLVRIHYAALCGTDLRIVAGTKTRDVRRGHPIGHEAAGTVAALGAGVTGYTVGERVGVCVVVSCGRCPYCQADRENLCETRITLGYQTDGAFADYMLIPERAVRRGNLFKLPPTVPLEIAPLIEPMACCLNGQHEMGLHEREARPLEPEGGSLVIFGAGPIGLLHLILARAGKGSAVRHVTVVEPRTERRACARRFGADAVCAPEAFDAVDAFDAAILAVGVPELVPAALRAVRKCGRVSLFAGFPVGNTARVDPNIVHYKQIRIFGASESRRRDYAEALDHVATGSVDPAPLITHRYRLEDYEAAFRTAAAGEALKVLFDMHSRAP